MFLQILNLILLLHHSNGCSDGKYLIFDDDYNPFKDPTHQNKTEVEVTLSFENFDAVDDSQKKFTFTAFLHMTWREDRIRMNPELDYVVKPKSFLTCIRAPGSHFYGMVDLTHVEELGRTIEIFVENIGNTSIRINYMSRVQAKINCPEFQFHWFPFDQQFCSIVLMLMTPKPDDATLNGQISFSKFNDIQYAPLAYYVSNEPLSKKDTEIFEKIGQPYFGTRLSFDRKLPPYNGYLSFPEMMVLISWLTYWIPYTSYPGRLAPLVILLLTLVNTFIKVRGVVPTCMDSMTVLEIYILVCIFQVLFVVLGYFHILVTLHCLKSAVHAEEMDPQVIEEQKIMKINRFYLIASPILNICMWIVIALYYQFSYM